MRSLHLVLLLALACACGDDDGSVGVGDGRDAQLNDRDAGGGASGGDADAGGLDGGGGGEGPPGATMDAAVLGLDAELMLPDGSWILADGAILLPDGRVLDVDAALNDYGVRPDVSRCEIMDDDVWQTDVEIEDEGGYALVPGPTGFGLAFRSLPMGNCAANVHVMHIPSSSGFPSSHAVLEECPAITDVSLATINGAWQLAWVDNLPGSAELHTMTLDAEMQAGQRRTLTDNSMQWELKPVLKQIAGRPMLIWITRNTATQQRRISAQWLDGDAEPVDLIAEQDAHLPLGLALAQVGDDRAVVGWVGTVDNPGAWLMRLDQDGMPDGEPIKLTELVSASSSIDVAYHESGGAAVYSIEIDGVPQVRFRRLDHLGMPVADERVVIGPPLRAQDASVFGVAGGFAIAYRALPGGSVSEPEIRMAFTTKEGMVLRDVAGSPVSFAIAPTTLATARTQLSVSSEGQIMIAFLDGNSTSNDNALHVVRRRLDCD